MVYTVRGALGDKRVLLGLRLVVDEIGSSMLLIVRHIGLYIGKVIDACDVFSLFFHSLFFFSSLFFERLSAP